MKSAHTNWRALWRSAGSASTWLKIKNPTYSQADAGRNCSSGESERQAVGLRPVVELRVFGYGHDTNASLDPHCCLDNPLRLFPACKLVGFFTPKGPGPTFFAKLGWEAQIVPHRTATCGAVYDDQVLHARQRSVISPNRKRLHSRPGGSACAFPGVSPQRSDLFKQPATECTLSRGENAASAHGA